MAAVPQSLLHVTDRNRASRAPDGVHDVELAIPQVREIDAGIRTMSR
jgi:hypothetical protein